MLFSCSMAGAVRHYFLKDNVEGTELEDDMSTGLILQNTHSDMEGSNILQMVISRDVFVVFIVSKQQMSNTFNKPIEGKPSIKMTSGPRPRNLRGWAYIASSSRVRDFENSWIMSLLVKLNCVCCSLMYITILQKHLRTMGGF